MKQKQILIVIAVALVTASLSAADKPAVNTFDVVVVGGTPAGVAAAIAAGRLGKSLILIEEAPVLGGMLSSGVLRLDDQYLESNSGVIEEFRQRVKSYHRTVPFGKENKEEYYDD